MRQAKVGLLFTLVLMVGCNKQETQVKGKDGESLKLSAPKSVSISAGETAKVKIGVTRDHFDGPVTIEFAQLPEGVSIVESDMIIAKGTNNATYTLKAADSAKGKGHALKVSASAQGMKAGPEEISVNISEKNGTESQTGSNAEKRKDLERATQAKLEEANQAIGKLKEKANNATGDAKVEWEKQRVNLEMARDKLQKQLDHASATTADAWDDFSRGVHNAAKDLEDATRHAWEKLKG